MRLLARALQILGGLLALALIAVFGLVVWWSVKVATYDQRDDAAHLADKRAYLERIAGLARIAAPARPNIVLILLDDLGYGDLGAYGAQAIATPHIDHLAASGLRLDDYYAPASICSPSRAALLTGRYAPRTLLTSVTFPQGHPIETSMKARGTAIRLPAEEILLPEILSAAGYTTGMVGKWHLGDHADSLPTRMGFDSYFGALYSNDMQPFALYRGEQIEHEAPFDQTRLNALYTREAVAFIEVASAAGAATTGSAQAGARRPFFLYYAHSFPHIPLHSAAASEGRSQAGLYGDVVEDIDDSVGAVMAALLASGRLHDTLVIVTSDNGPWYEGNPGAVRGRKNESWEGGQRVPFIAHWPGRIEGGRESSAQVVGVDLVPTLLGLLDLPAPSDRNLDGLDLREFLFDGADPPERLVYYFDGDTLDAVRDARFKYHRRRGVRSVALGQTLSLYAPQGPWLFDLALDPAESWDATRRHPEAAERLARAFAERNDEMERNPRGWR